MEKEKKGKMLSEAELNSIEKIVKELVEKMGFVCEVEIIKAKEDSEETLVYNIKAEESSFLIGQYGVNLQSLQHLARVIARKKLDIKAHFMLDVNSYRQERNNSIVKLAKTVAEQALREKRAVVLKPMSAYERRIIHLELSKNDLVKTESMGEGEDRKIVISPVNLV